MESLESTIREAVREKRRWGYTLISSGWVYEEQKCRCALSMLLPFNIPDNGTILRVRKLLVDQGFLDPAIVNVPMWVVSFTAGFDGGDPEGIDYPAAFKLGALLRKDLSPIRASLVLMDKTGHNKLSTLDQLQLAS